ncbi:hypothetical protein Dimus_017411 [Dionaea muscipula]
MGKKKSRRKSFKPLAKGLPAQPEDSDDSTAQIDEGTLEEDAPDQFEEETTHFEPDFLPEVHGEEFDLDLASMENMHELNKGKCPIVGEGENPPSLGVSDTTLRNHNAGQALHEQPEIQLIPTASNPITGSSATSTSDLNPRAPSPKADNRFQGQRLYLKTRMEHPVKSFRDE